MYKDSQKIYGNTMPKKRNIDRTVLKEIAERYISNRKSDNLARLGKEYDIPYSTLRRYLLKFIKIENLEESITEDFLPYEGFEYLKIGDTYQFSDHLTIWLIKSLKKIDGEKVFIIIPVHKKTYGRHWICNDLVIDDV